MSSAIRADGRIDIFRNQILVIVSEGLRFAKSAVGTPVFPGVNRQSVAFKAVVTADTIAPITFGAIADHLAIVRHGRTAG